MGFHQKTKGICTTKETINRLKRQPKYCERILANHTSDKGLTFQMYKEFKHHNSKKANNPIFKMGKEPK
jgi:hypothetical protein